MDESNARIFKHYAIHSTLQWFAQTLLVSFGALFIYVKTGSIGLALAAIFAENIADLIVRSKLVEWWWNVLLRRRQVRAMAVGLTITAVSSLGIYFTSTSSHYSTPLFLFFAWLGSIGTSVYWIPSNALFFRTAGSSNAPGHYSAVISILHILAAIVAAGAGLALNIQNNFLFLLPLVALLALVSLIPLAGLDLPIERPVSWKRSWDRISFGCYWGNFIGDYSFQNTGVALVLVALYGSYSQSVSITSFTLILAAVLGYFAGKLKDRNNRSLFVITTVVLAVAWVAYGFTKTPAGFVVLGALVYALGIILSIGRDARVTREAANGNHFIESAIGIEFTRATGTMAGLLVLIVAYWFTDSMPQMVLLAGALFIIPKGLYAIGAVEKLKLT